MASQKIVGKKMRPPTRTQRWQTAAGDALTALQALQEVQEEYQEWMDNLPENLQSSAVGEKLQGVCDLDIASALETAEEADAIDLPLGFGRD